MDVPGDPRTTYIARMDWAANSSDELVLQHLNRLQNRDEVMLADARTGKVRAVLDESGRRRGSTSSTTSNWIDGGKSVHLDLSERDGWRHLYVGADRDGGIRRSW